MNEYNSQIIASLKILWLSGFSIFYGLGGISNKWLRRYVAPAWMMLGIFIFSSWGFTWNYWYLLCYPLMVIALSIGYGGTDDVAVKIRKRAIYGLVLSFTAIPLVVFSHLWVLFGFHVCLSVLSSVLLGVFNPTKNARSEETLISTLCLLMMLFLI